MANVTISQLDSYGSGVSPLESDLFAIYDTDSNQTRQASIKDILNTPLTDFNNISTINAFLSIRNIIGQNESLDIGTNIINAINTLNTKTPSSHYLFLTTSTDIGGTIAWGTLYLCAYNQQNEVYLPVDYFASASAHSEPVVTYSITEGEYQIYIPSITPPAGSLTLSNSLINLQDYFKLVFVPTSTMILDLSYSGDYVSCVYRPDLISSPSDGIVVNGNVVITHT